MTKEPSIRRTTTTTTTRNEYWMKCSDDRSLLSESALILTKIVWSSYTFCLDGNFTRLEIDFTTKEFKSQSNRAFFQIGTKSYRFHVHQQDANMQKNRASDLRRTVDGIRLHPTKLVTLLPAVAPKAHCLWDLDGCSSGKAPAEGHSDGSILRSY
jgi:hypothetical protein